MHASDANDDSDSDSDSDSEETVERSLDLGEVLDSLLGLAPAEAYAVLVVDRAAGGLHAYGPYSENEVHAAAAQFREELEAAGLSDVSAHVVALHAPGQ